MTPLKISTLLLLLLVSCNSISSNNSISSDINFKQEFIAYGFDFPVGKPNGKGYYDAQPFGENHHLGEDWNAYTGGNSDLGDPIYTIANGYVKFAKDAKGGWGNVIRVLHKLPNGQEVESLYAHCDTIIVKSGDWIKKGDKIGTIGTAHEQYYAHLHLELREIINMPIGKGYAKDKTGYLAPTKFIKNHRKIKK